MFSIPSRCRNVLRTFKAQNDALWNGTGGKQDKADRIRPICRKQPERTWRRETGDFHISWFYALLFAWKDRKVQSEEETSKKKLAKKSKEINAMIRDMRFLHINQIVKKLNEILTGYYHYYGITDNSKSLNSFYNVVWFRYSTG